MTANPEAMTSAGETSMAGETKSQGFIFWEGVFSQLSTSNDLVKEVPIQGWLVTDSALIQQNKCRWRCLWGSKLMVLRCPSFRNCKTITIPASQKSQPIHNLLKNANLIAQKCQRILHVRNLREKRKKVFWVATKGNQNPHIKKYSQIMCKQASTV